MVKFVRSSWASFVADLAVGGAVDISQQASQANFVCARQAIIRDVHGGRSEEHTSELSHVVTSRMPSSA